MRHYIFLLLAQVWLASAAIDFEAFTTCAQSVLHLDAPSDCDHGTSTQAAVNADWACLCSSTAFLVESAQDIWQYCGCSDLETTASVWSKNCAIVGWTVGYDEYIAGGDGKQLPCVPPPTPKLKLAVGDIVGIVTGVVGFIALIIAFLQLACSFGWIKKKYAPWPQIVRIICCFTIPRQEDVELGGRLAPPYNGVMSQNMERAY
ncbi:hypothetical protein BDZ45DRAFT_746371 [Acephala macrosclerotiorum]|nr:hypothetical protein BDZ45DRAFT_746371 [Acephala macrosclerotiorum]